MLRWSEDQLREHHSNRQGKAEAKAEAMQHVIDKQRPKYRNKKTVVDGTTFDSKAEAARYVELKKQAEANEIHDLMLQVPFELAPSVKFSGKRATPSLRYFADFVYSRDGNVVVEDVKSPATMTQAFRIKKHLMLSVLGIEIKVIQ